jgi:predicted metalloprotease with PDZ domain
MSSGAALEIRPKLASVRLAALAAALAGGLAAAPALAQAQDPGPNGPVQYDVSFPNAVHHEARITVTYRDVGKAPLKLMMARSSPGRYAMHEFAKNVYSVSATDGAGHPLPIQRTEPYSWTVAGHDGTVRLSYTLFADWGDGTYAQVDATHAHLNMPAVFMFAPGFEARPIRVRFHRIDPKWKIATQLPAAGEPDTFWAPGLQYFMDSPTELSDFKLREWQVTDAQGRTATFRLALHDPGTDADADAFAAQLKQLVPQHIAVFGELPKFDFGTYTFIADFSPQVVRDGMEHRNSTFLTYPQPLLRGGPEHLGGASHEFVHAWNVKRLRPAELEPFDFTRADPTPSLWLAEGFTDHYGPLMIRRSGQSTVDEYLEAISGDLSYVLTGSGHNYGSPQEMSLRAPFLDQAVSIDRVNRNTTVSYYPYGHEVALALDLELRGRFNLTLDDYMRRLWRTYGATATPYRPADLRETLVALTGDRAFAEGFFKASVEGTRLPDFAPLFARAGLVLRPKSPGRAWLGVTRVKADGPELVIDQNPPPGSPLYVAGVDRDDRILAIGRLEIKGEADWTDALAHLKPGEATIVRFVQRGRTLEAPLTVAADPTLEVVRGETAGKPPTPAQLAFRDRWLGPDTAKPAAPTPPPTAPAK